MSETLDQVVSETPCIMKLDVEGSELAGLRGARGLLREEARRPAVIFMESCAGGIRYHGFVVLAG